MPTYVVSGGRSTLSAHASGPSAVDQRPRSLLELMKVLDLDDYPLINLIGLNGPRVTNPKVEWSRDKYVPISTTLQTALTTATTSVVVAAGTGVYFQVGHVIRFPTANSGAGEVMLVTAVATDTLTVVRGTNFGNTTDPGTLGSGVRIDIIGTAVAENADSPAFGTTIPSQDYNYVQDIQKRIQTSWKAKNTKWYGVEGSLHDRNARKTFESAMRELEMSLMWGVRQLNVANSVYTSGGLEHFIGPTNGVNVVSGAAGAVTEKMVEDAQEAVYQKVGRSAAKSLTIVCSMKFKRKLKQLYANVTSNSNYKINIERDSRVGGFAVDAIETSMGRVGIVASPFLEHNESVTTQNRAYFINPVDDAVKGAWYKGLELQIVPMNNSGGAYDFSQIVGSYTLMVGQPEAHAVLHNFIVSLV